MKISMETKRVVVAGLRPAVEGGILPPDFAFGVHEHKPAGQDAWLYRQAGGPPLLWLQLYCAPRHLG